MSRTQKIVTFYFEYEGQEHSFGVPEEMIHGYYSDRSRATGLPIPELIRQDFIRIMKSKNRKKKQSIKKGN
jgi:hypothetical protein